MLSWAYTVQWPLFALFVGFLWVRAVRDVLGPRPVKTQEPLRPRVDARGARPPQPPRTTRSSAEYNRMLAWLAANPDRRPGDFPG